MSRCSISVSCPQLSFCIDVLPHGDADALVDAECAQSVWGSREGCGPAVELPRSLTDSSSSLPGSPTTEQSKYTELDEEEFGDFEKATTDAFKQPIYHNATEDVDETLELLNTHSAPEWQTGFFVGVGLVEPARATLDTSTRNLRKAGKLVLRRLNMEREKLVPGAEDTNNHSSQPAQHDDNDDDVSALHRVFAGLDLYEYVESINNRPATPNWPLNGVIRPVSFPQPDSEETRRMAEMDGIMAEERRIWA